MKAGDRFIAQIKGQELLSITDEYKVGMELSFIKILDNTQYLPPPETLVELQIIPEYSLS